jgi:hypothetical protein
MCLMPVAEAGVTVFRDRASFEQAAGAIRHEITFDRSDLGPNETHALDGASFSSAATFYDCYHVNQLCARNPQVFWRDGALLLPGMGHWFRPLMVEFGPRGNSSPHVYSAVGFDLKGENATIGGRFVDTTTGMMFESFAAEGAGFVGFVTTQSFSGFYASGLYSTSLDALYLPVPEPGTYALLASGVLALGLYKRQAKKHGPRP